MVRREIVALMGSPHIKAKGTPKPEASQFVPNL